LLIQENEILGVDSPIFIFTFIFDFGPLEDQMKVNFGVETISKELRYFSLNVTS